MLEQIGKIQVKKSKKSRNIHKSLRFILFLAQIFGFFPLQNVLSDDINRIRYNWRSIRFISSIISIVGGASVAIGHLAHMTTTGYDQFEMNGAIFYCCGIFSTYIFIKLAKCWCKITTRWRQLDVQMVEYGWPIRLNRQILTISIVFLLFEAAEHFLIQTNKLLVAIKCHEGSLVEGIAHFSINMSFPVIFNTIPYHPAIALLYQIINTRMAFSWTFTDLFVILLSCALASRFKQINKKIRYLQKAKNGRRSVWMRVKDDYAQLCELCAFIDERISWLILISFFNNFYFLIFQVYGSLNIKGSPVLEKLYYFISLILLLLRMISVTVYSSWVYEESRLPIEMLTSSSYDIYNVEIQKFIDNVHSQPSGFTGKKMFRITKHLILKIASAVITYELVVIQFNQEVSTNANKPSRNSFC